MWRILEGVREAPEDPFAGLRYQLGRDYSSRERFARGSAAYYRERYFPIIREDIARRPEARDLSPEALDDLARAAAAEAFGFGPLQELLDAHDITEILVNGPRAVYVECGGKLHLTDRTFWNEDHVVWIAERLLEGSERIIGANAPIVEARASD